MEKVKLYIVFILEKVYAGIGFVCISWENFISHIDVI